MTPNFNIAILSRPNPKARPQYTFESMLQFSKTVGFIIPQPNISNHFPSFDSISTSAEGSVNGKYEGLNLISILFPKRSLIIL